MKDYAAKTKDDLDKYLRVNMEDITAKLFGLNMLVMDK